MNPMDRVTVQGFWIRGHIPVLWEQDQDLSICVVDPDPLSRAGLAAILDATSRVNVTLETASFEAALECVDSAPLDLVVATGTTLGETITELLANREQPQTIVVISRAEQSVRRLLRAGVRGVVCRDSVGSELPEAVHCIRQGMPFISASLMSEIVDELQHKTNLPDSPENSLILWTKLHQPPLPADFLPRPRLLELLEKGRENPLTLVSAPAGYGKSNVVCHWLDSTDWLSAWISLDRDDGDLPRFLEYLGAAIESLGQGSGRNVQALAYQSSLPPMETVVRIVSNELDSIPEPVILVLDDYHLIPTSSSVHEFFIQLLRHPPLSLHLVLIARRDPPLPLVSMRAKGQMTDLRMLDLVFSTEESIALMQRLSSVELSDPDAIRLESLLEGWVAGLRLMALALQKSANPEKLLRNIEMGSIGVRGYLLQEVLESLDESMQTWLLASSIVPRLCAGLCEAICPIDLPAAAQFDAYSFISALVEQNLFVIPLDNNLEWFRYHHEFQDLLQNELIRRQSTQEVAELHRRAGKWFADNGYIQDAIEHYLAAEQPDLAARLVAAKCLEQLDQDRDPVVRRWLVGLPSALWEKHLEILVAAARLAAVVQAEPHKAKQYMLSAAKLIEQRGGESPGWFVSEVNYLEGVVLYWSGDAHTSRQRLETSMQDIPLKGGVIEGNRHLFLGLATHVDGDPRLAISRLTEVDERNHETSVALRGRFAAALSYLHYLSGDLAATRVQGHRLRAMSIKDARSLLVLTWGEYMVGISFLQSGDFQQAIVYLERFMAQRQSIDGQVTADAVAALALAYQLTGDTTSAGAVTKVLSALSEENRNSSWLRIARSSAARLALLRGDTQSAEELLFALDEGLVSTDRFLWIEIPALTRVRVLLSMNSAASSHQAREFVENLRQQFQDSHLFNQTVEAMVLQVLILRKLHRAEDAMRVLNEVLNMAAPGGWVRPFMEAGVPMADLLQRLDPLSEHAEFVARVLQEVHSERASSVATVGNRPKPNLMEPLTNRELEVLALLQQRLQNKEIASKLHVSVETVKTHLKHLYAKLGASNRRQAVQKSAELLASLRS